jgi:hypothetical protein
MAFRLVAIEEMQYWLSEFESLGLKVRLNEFNNLQETGNLIENIKQRYIKKYKATYSKPRDYV